MKMDCGQDLSPQPLIMGPTPLLRQSIMLSHAHCVLLLLPCTVATIDYALFYIEVNVIQFL